MKQQKSLTSSFINLQSTNSLNPASPTLRSPLAHQDTVHPDYARKITIRNVRNDQTSITNLYREDVSAIKKVKIREDRANELLEMELSRHAGEKQKVIKPTASEERVLERLFRAKTRQDNATNYEQFIPKQPGNDLFPTPKALKRVTPLPEKSPTTG